jgi:hypothetical protein
VVFGSIASPQSLTEVQFDSGKDGFPLIYTVSISSDGTSWTKVGQKNGVPGINTLNWKAQGKSTYLKIEANSKGEKQWSMKRLTLFSR